MTIYIILIVYVLLLAVMAERLFDETERRERFVLDFGMLALFLLFSLKKETVGIDILGYQEQYAISAAVPWDNTGYVYFEAGFIQLMKLFSKLKLDFQVFTVFIYGVCCVAYRQFIRRYSPNAALSLLIFICYQFLVFYMSGLRQALAMAVCICAYLLLDGKWGSRWLRFLCAAALVLAASTIHRSALLALVVIVFVQWQPNRVHWVLMSVFLAVAVFFRAPVHRFIEFITGDEITGGQITLGGNFVFLLGMAVFCVLGYYNRQEAEGTFYPTAVNVLMLAVVAQILFSGSALLRGAMYLTVFLIPGLPCALKRFEPRIEVLGTWLLGVFLVWLFWHDTLSINQLNLCPYLFFWQ